MESGTQEQKCPRSGTAQLRSRAALPAAGDAGGQPQPPEPVTQFVPMSGFLYFLQSVIKPNLKVNLSYLM